MSYHPCPHCGGEGGYTDEHGFFQPACAVCHGSGALPYFSRHLIPELPLKASPSTPVGANTNPRKEFLGIGAPVERAGVVGEARTGARTDGTRSTDSQHNVTED